MLYEAMHVLHMPENILESMHCLQQKCTFAERTHTTPISIPLQLRGGYGMFAVSLRTGLV